MGVLHDALPHLESQVQAGKARITLLETLHDPQRVQIVVEAVAETSHQPVELLFARMRERRMADIVDQRQRFGQILIESEGDSGAARNLRHFDGMGQTIAEVVGQTGREIPGSSPPDGETRAYG